MHIDSAFPVLKHATRWRWLGAGVLILLLPVLLVVGLAVVGVDIDINAQRATVARMISKQVGREVRIDGKVHLRLGLRPQLRLRDLAIGQPKGFAAGDFLRLGQLELKLDLIPLLAGRYRADRIAASDVRLSLQQREDETNNWTFDGSPSSDKDEGEAFDTHEVAGIDIRQLDLDNITVTFQSGGARPIEFRLDQLDATLPVGGGVTLKAKGMVERTMPYQLAINGGPLSDLLRGKPGWPVSMQLSFADGVLVAQGKLGEKGSALSFGLGAPDPTALAGSGGGLGGLESIREALFECMWNDVGILRTGAGLQRALVTLAALDERLAQTGVDDEDRAFNLSWHDWINLKNLISVSRVIATSALAREDSRGAHFREDHPQTGDLPGSTFIVVTQTGTKLDMRREPVVFSRVIPGQTILEENTTTP
jgi:hypothetical protein